MKDLYEPDSLPAFRKRIKVDWFAYKQTDG